jgi:LuxR family transcriptional regulator, maltose regulon positive regulatory protein
VHNERQPDSHAAATWESSFSRPAGVVARRRLVEAFEVGQPLTLVCAPAGFGKSVLVGSWVAGVGDGCTVVRMVLDDDAVDPRVFWASVVDGVRGVGVDVSGVAVGSVHRHDLAFLAQHLEAHRVPVVWVLDCGEFSLSPSVCRGLDLVIRRCGGRLGVVLLSRSDPPLPLNRYRLDGLLTDIRAADLAFTTAEVAALMRVEGLDLAPRDVSVLHARTGGWPAGVRFAAMSLAARTDTGEAIQEIRGDTGNVAEYLMSEVLAKQSRGAREFLLRTCVADELVPDLVGSLTGRPCDLHLLEVMSRGNSFIELVPGRHDRYRYHALFREFLRGRLAFESPGLVGQLHRVAAEWLVADGQVFAAIRHAARAQQWQMATELLVDRLGFAELLMGWKDDRLRAMFTGLPDEAPGTTAAVTRAALSLSELDLPRSELHLAAARRLLAEDRSPQSQVRGLAIAVLHAVTASLGADTDAGLRAALVAERAIRLAPTRDLDALMELSAIVSGCKGRVLFERGDLAAGSQVLADGVRTAEAAHLAGAQEELKGMSALVEAVTGRLRRATRLALEVVPGTGDPVETASDDPVLAHPPIPGVEAATLALAWVRTDESELQLARELLRQAERQQASYDSKVLGAVLSLLRARLLWSDGDFELALAELRGAGEPMDLGSGSLTAPVTGWLAETLVVGEAASLVALERPAEAIGLLRPLEGGDNIAAELVRNQALAAVGADQAPVMPSEHLIAQAPLAAQVEGLILLAEQSLRDRDPARAEELLERALRIASSEHLRRPFREAGDDVRACLEHSGLSGKNRWLGATGATEASDTTADLVPLPGRGAQEHLHSSPIVIPLTPKESEVLGYLAELLTTDEIAATMFVSVNTIRSHVRSILRKLGVGRRNEAVRLAWELRLLPAPGPDPTTLAQ